jgi:3-oxoacyl-[acyl-carrier protein] reductase
MTNTLVITGGSRGIGKAAIEIFKQNHWRVINISRTACDINDVINFKIDLSNPDSAQEHAKELLQSVAGTSKLCLVHNAAFYEKDSISNLTADSLRSALEFNLVAPLILNQLLLPNMKNGSSIIYIGSTLSEMGVPSRASYTISKHALVGMMRSTCQDLAGTGISTSCICPGFVNTKMLTDQVDKKILDAIVKSKVCDGRLIEPDEIANLIYFCATNPVVNGSVIHANLGQITT